MKIRDLQRIIREELPDLKNAMSMSTWNIVIDFEKIDNPDCDARIRSYKPYEDASITIDHTKIIDRKDFLNSIRHEFLHCLMPDFALLEHQLRQVLPDKIFNIIDQTVTSIEERSVKCIENMLDFGLGFTAVKMVRRGRRKI